MTLKEKRIEMGLTQIKAAKLCKVSYATYKLWEYGGSSPNEKNLKRVCEVFDIDESFFKKDDF